jgi:hypothetical protein
VNVKNLRLAQRQVRTEEWCYTFWHGISPLGRYHGALMNAEPLLTRIARALAEHRLEAVMVGNAAAALHGAPVTTLDIDFMFRRTPTNMRKLKAVARTHGASIFRPYYSVSELFRLVNDDQNMQVDFMPRLDGIR